MVDDSSLIHFNDSVTATPGMPLQPECHYKDLTISCQEITHQNLSSKASSAYTHNEDSFITLVHKQQQTHLLKPGKITHN